MNEQKNKKNEDSILLRQINNQIKEINMKEYEQPRLSINYSADILE